ncbi:MAG TPA: uroporphyrinogen-III C-methyltransferase [Gemmatimonadaceae bacterium]|nr:uroporphyrinogen-III C-methyltransferase [Gemmatimonadaceae bacterium]
MSGIVYLVGAGPGDPGLLTVRGRELLADCDAVVFDALANPALLPAPDERGRPALHDVGKRGGSATSARQDEINALLVALGREGKRVVRLKGGDPFVFGRGSEEADALREAGVAFEVVPGVTAGIAAPAYAGIPVTHRGVATSVTFVTGHEDPAQGEGRTDWAALARAGGTIVLYMGVKSLPRIASSLAAGGLSLDTPAAAVQWGTRAAQRTVVATLGTLAERASAAGVTAPVITVIGPVVALRERIAWLEARPLFGARIVVTRAASGPAAPGRRGLAERLRALGAEVIEAPATRLEPLDGRPLGSAVARLSGYDWIAFTSQVAVDLVWTALREAGLDARALAGRKVCAVGPATAETLLARGIAPDVVPERFVAEGLLEVLAARDDVRGARVLYVAAEGARDALPAGLEALGATVETVRAYRSVPDAEGARVASEALRAGEVHYVAYASAGAVKAFVDAVGDAARRAPAACIGPITASAAREAGLEVAVESATSTTAALADALVEAWHSRRNAGGDDAR